MSSESVRILIEAEDKASAQVANASKAIEANVQGIKDVSQKAKASTEFIGVLATTLGGSQIGAFAGQLGQITEKVSQFAEVQKLGGAGAIAFKLGLAGMVGALAYQVGSALGNAIFQTDAYAKKLEQATEASKKLAQASIEMANAKNSMAIEDAELIRDPIKQEQEVKFMLDQINKNLLGTEAKVRASQRAVNEWEKAWQITGERKGEAAAAQAQLEADQAQLGALKNQRLAILEKFGPRAQELALIREQNKAADEAAAKEMAASNQAKEKLRELRNKYDELTIGVEAARAARMREAGMTEGDIKREQNLQRMVDLKEREAEATKKLAQEQMESAKRVVELQKNEITQLEQKRIELTQGKEAAAAFALEQQGLDKAAAAQLAREKMRIEALEEAKNKKVEQAQPNTATESRILARGKQDTHQEKIEENTKIAANALQTIAELFKEQKQVKKVENPVQPGLVLVAVRP